MKISFLSNKIPWFGSQTGYECLPEYLKEKSQVSILGPGNGKIRRAIGKLYSLYKKWPQRNNSDAYSELFFSIKSNFQVRHILYLESHLFFFSKWQKAPKNIVTTIHLPPSQWSTKNLDLLRRVSSAIVLYRKDIPFFEQFVGTGNVHFIPHGVNINYFKPADALPDYKEKRILFAGHYLRNLDMLERVVLQIKNRFPEVKFDFLVPEIARTKDVFVRLSNEPSIHWHKNISDSELVSLYQNSYLHLIPMNDSGANTAIIESLACGLPVVTTDVGGIRDYGGGTIFPIVENNNDKGLVELIERYMNDVRYRNDISQGCREFAEKTLVWDKIADSHIKFYNTILVY